MQFTSAEDVARLADTVKSYVEEAIEVEEAGREVGPAPELAFVEELQVRLDNDPVFKTAFEALTRGRQREYNLYFSDAKQTKSAAKQESRSTPRGSWTARASATDDLRLPGVSWADTARPR